MRSDFLKDQRLFPARYARDCKIAAANRYPNASTPGGCRVPDSLDTLRAVVDAALTLHDSEIAMRELINGLRRQLRSRLGSEHDAEDLAQEACLKFFVEWQRRDDIRNPRAYLLQIARNLLYLHYRRQSRSVLDTDVDIDALFVDEPGLEGLLNDAQRVDKIQTAWRELSPKCQQVLRLRWRDGLRVAEIAERMNLSKGMVKKYLARGLTHCRRRLRRHIEVEGLAA